MDQEQANRVEGKINDIQTNMLRKNSGSGMFGWVETSPVPDVEPETVETYEKVIADIEVKVNDMAEEYGGKACDVIGQYVFRTYNTSIPPDHWKELMKRGHVCGNNIGNLCNTGMDRADEIRFKPQDCEEAQRIFGIIPRG